MVLAAILNSPVAVREIIDLGDKLRKHKIRVKDIIRDAEDDNAEFDEEEADRRILRLIDKVKHLDKVAQDLDEERCRRAPPSRKKGIEGEIDANRQKMVETLEEMRLNKKTIDKVVAKLRGLIQKIERAESGIVEIAKRAGVEVDAAPQGGPPVAGRRERRAQVQAQVRRHARRRPGRALRRPEEPEEGRGRAAARRQGAARDLRGHPRGRAHRRPRQGRARRGEPAPRRQHREEVHEPRPAVPRLDPGGEHRPDEGRRQVRVQARLQVQHVRDLVDPAGHHPRHRRSGAHHPHPGAHDRDDQQAHPDEPLPRPGVRPRADARRDRGEDGAAARQGPQGPQDCQGAHQPRDPHRRGGRLASGRLHRGQERGVARPRRSST